MDYPISELNYSITDYLSSIDIVRETVQKGGLKNNIILTEENNGYDVLSEIDPNGQVYLSPSFCQFIWNVSYSALIVTDTSIILNELKKVGINKDEFLTMISAYNSVPEVSFLISELNAISWEDILQAGYECQSKIVTQDTEQLLTKINLSSPFSQRVSGLYRAAISFVLLHELFHWRRNHFRCGKKRIEMEKEADDYAFNEMLQSSTDKTRKTNTIGPICTLLSFFFINPQFINNGRYPYEDERLFAQFDKLIGVEKEACRSIIVNIMEVWARFFKISGFPILTGCDESDLDNIRKFLSSYMRP